MDKAQIAHDLAVAYAKGKLAEYDLDHRDAIANGYLELDLEEINLLKSAYDFAIKNLV